MDFNNGSEDSDSNSSSDFDESQLKKLEEDLITPKSGHLYSKSGSTEGGVEVDLSGVNVAGEGKVRGGTLFEALFAGSKEDGGVLKFYNEAGIDNTNAGSIHPSQDPRNKCSDAAIEKDPSGCNVVEVPQLTCASLMEKHGVPMFLKIDIEGADIYCLESLRRLKAAGSALPKYVAIEDNNALGLLEELGYSQFKLYYGREINDCLIPSGALSDKVPGFGDGGWPDQCINDVVEGLPKMGSVNTWSSAAELRSYEYYNKAPPASPHPYDLVAML